MSRSVDLREAAVAYYEEGYTLIETGKVFKVGKTTVSSWVKKKRETGDLHNKPLNRSFKKIDPEKLKAYVREYPDATQKEISKIFGCCNQAVSKALKRCGITRKKRPRSTKSRIWKSRSISGRNQRYSARKDCLCG